mgnify:CR=1 FL=1
MVANALDVEPVTDVDTSREPIDTVGRSTHASTIYQLQLAFMAARLAALERELELERGRRTQVQERYERLLAERDDRIATLERQQADGILATLRSQG